VTVGINFRVSFSDQKPLEERARIRGASTGSSAAQ